MSARLPAPGAVTSGDMNSMKSVKARLDEKLAMLQRPPEKKKKKKKQKKVVKDSSSLKDDSDGKPPPAQNVGGRPTANTCGGLPTAAASISVVTSPTAILPVDLSNKTTIQEMLTPSPRPPGHSGSSSSADAIEPVKNLTSTSSGDTKEEDFCRKPLPYSGQRKSPPVAAAVDQQKTQKQNDGKKSNLQESDPTDEKSRMVHDEIVVDSESGKPSPKSLKMKKPRMNEVARLLASPHIEKRGSSSSESELESGASAAESERKRRPMRKSLSSSTQSSTVKDVTSPAPPLVAWRATDVILGRGKSNLAAGKGNHFYTAELAKNTDDLGKVDIMIIVDRVLQSVSRQKPPGRFVSSDQILTDYEAKRKVAADLQERARKIGVATSGRNIPDGGLRSTDVLGGRGRKQEQSREGNHFYVKELTKGCTEFNKGNAQIIVDRIVKAVESQKPPGRFVSGGRILTPEEVRRKVSAGLHEKARKLGMLAANQNDGDSVSIEEDVKIVRSADVGAIKILPTDVVCGRGKGNGPQRIGNRLYTNEISKHCGLLDTLDFKVVIDRVLQAIEKQSPPGRFVSDSRILPPDEVRHKVKNDLRGKARKLEAQGGNDDAVEDDSITNTDVICGRGKGNGPDMAGNQLYINEISKRAVDLGTVKLKELIDGVLRAIESQLPPGRFVSGRRILTNVEVRRKVAADFHQKARKLGMSVAKQYDGHDTNDDIREQEVVDGISEQKKEGKRKRNELELLLSNNCVGTAETSTREFETSVPVAEVVLSTSGFDPAQNRPPGPKRRRLEPGGDPRNVDGEEHRASAVSTTRSGRILRVYDSDSDGSVGDGGRSVAAKADGSSHEPGRAAFVLRDTDVVIGSVERARMRKGNMVYNRAIEKNCLSVDKVPMDDLIQNIIKELEAQDPPGRFVFNGNVLDDSKRLNRKIISALQSKKRKLLRTAKQKESKEWQAAAQRQADREAFLSRPVVELMPSDVLDRYTSRHPGTLIYREFVAKMAEEMDKEDIEELTKRVLDHVSSRTPPGRMIREGRLLNDEESEARVVAALEKRYATMLAENKLEDRRRELKETTREDAKLPAYKKRKVGDVEPRSTDVLSRYSLSDHPGTNLYRKLIDENASKVGKASLEILRDRILKKIYSQKPPGRFLADGRIMAHKSVMRKIIIALKESAGLNPKKNGGKKKKRTSTAVTIAPGAVPKHTPKKVIRGAGRAIEGDRRSPSVPVVLTDFDVPGGSVKGHPGNLFYRNTVEKHSKDIGKLHFEVLIQRVIDDVHKRDPPGRFLRHKNNRYWLMSEEDTYIKVEKSMLSRAAELGRIQGKTKAEIRFSFLDFAPGNKSAAKKDKK